MRSCRSLGKPVRQIREPSEGFRLKHSYYIFASFVKDKVSIGVWVYLWAFYFDAGYRKLGAGALE